LSWQKLGLRNAAEKDPGPFLTPSLVFLLHLNWKKCRRQAWVTYRYSILFLTASVWAAFAGTCNQDFYSYLSRKGNTKMNREWQFLSVRWWLVHLLGFSLVYGATWLNSLWFR
jgi:hypothetical protein